MTKRALSLLLTLVMVLSLCVPALAADEFEAETAAVAEEEQAPVAPVEPEALEETEEVEAVAVPAEADEPAVIYAPATDEDCEEIHQAIDTAKKIKEKIDAGKIYGSAYTFEKWMNDEPDTQVADFLHELEIAEKMEEEARSDYNIWTKARLDEEAGKLAAADDYLGEYVRLSGWGSSFYLKYYEAHEMFKDIPTNIPEDVEEYYFQDGWYEKVLDMVDLVKEAESKVFNQETYQLSYDIAIEVLTMAYKDKLYDAVQGVGNNGLNGGLDTNDLYNFVPAEGAGEAVRANRDDYNDLKAYIDELQAVLDAGVAMSSTDPIYVAAVAWLGAAKATYDPLSGTGLNPRLTHKGVLDLIDKLDGCIDALHPNTFSWQLASWRLNEARDTLFIFVDLPDQAYDWHSYKLNVSMTGSNGAQYKFNATTLASDEVTGDNPGIGSWMRCYATVQKHDILTNRVVDFDDNDTLTVELTDGDGNRKGSVLTITIGDDLSPQVVGAGFAKNTNVGVNNAFYLTLNARLDWFENAGYLGSRIEVTKPNGDTFKKALTSTGGTLSEANANNVYWVDSDVQVGTYSISYYVTKGNKEIGPKTANITVKDITNYTKYSKLTDAIADAANYQQMVATKASGKTTAEARQAVANALAVANAIVNAAATTPDTTGNNTTVDTATTNLKNAMKNLTTAADQSDLDAAIAEAKALVQTDYSASTWKTLTDAVTAGEKVKKTAVSASHADAKAIADAAKDIRDAIKNLSPLKPDLTGLQALVDSVPSRLAADNYTAESKAAVNTAAAAARAALAKAGVTRSEIAKAMADLQAALNALKVIPAGDPSGVQPPKGGTGWVYDPTTGDDYYFIDGVMKKDYWVGDHDGASKWNFWYYLGVDGKLVKGFHYITNPNGTGWYMLQDNDKNGCRGKLLSGWQYTNSSAGTGYFTETRGVNYGKCTRTDAWGAYNPADNTWGSAHTAH